MTPQEKRNWFAQTATPEEMRQIRAHRQKFDAARKKLAQEIKSESEQIRFDIEELTDRKPMTWETAFWFLVVVAIVYAVIHGLLTAPW